MKKASCFFTVLLALSFFATFVFAEQKIGGKTVENFSPDPASYKKISKEEAKKMRNYSSSEQHEITVQMKALPGKSDGANEAGKD